MNNPTRRTVLKILASVIATGFTGNGISATQTLLASTTKSLNGRLNYTTFAALVGQPFSLIMVDQDSKYRVKMQLVEINSVFLSPENDQFTLIFQLFHPKAKPNGVYRVIHSYAGSTRLFFAIYGR